jgi:hypothetical protein
MHLKPASYWHTYIFQFSAWPAFQTKALPARDTYIFLGLPMAKAPWKMLRRERSQRHPYRKRGKEKKERIMHNSLIKYVGVSRIERHPSKAIGGP